MNTNAKKIFTTAGISLFFVLILSYAFFVSKDLLFGIRIRNVNIEDGARFNESVQDITGNARNAIKLTLNGREIPINQEGDFKETMALLPGYNIISLRAEDKFGYIDEQNYKLMYTK